MSDVSKSIGLGVAAGAAGTVALDVASYLDMAIRGRSASDVPGEVAARLARLAGVTLLDDSAAGGDADAGRVSNRKTAVGSLLGRATGVDVGAAYGIARAFLPKVPWQLAGLGLAAAAMAASDVPATRLRVTDPRRWSVSDWASDIVPHLAYGLIAAFTYESLSRVAGAPLRSRRKPTVDAEDIEQLKSLIRGIETAMLTTVDASGRPQSRPMATQRVDADGSLWFFAGRDSGATVQARMHDVNVSYVDVEAERYVSVSGLAEVVTDRDTLRELWKPQLETWFRGGADDPNLTLLRVLPSQAHYWDKRSSVIVDVFDAEPALTKG